MFLLRHDANSTLSETSRHPCMAVAEFVCERDAKINEHLYDSKNFTINYVIGRDA